MIDIKFENDTFSSLQILMKNHNKTGELRLLLPNNSSMVTWVGQPDKEDLSLTLIVTALKER